MNIAAAVIDYMKLFEIGFNSSTSKLTWTDIFIADYAGNYIEPVWDSSVFGSIPIEPDTYYADSTPPEVLEWFIDAATKQINIAFTEPVIINDITGVTIWESVPLAELFSYSFDTVTTVLPSEADPRVMVATINNRCIGDPTAALDTCTGDFDNIFNLFSNTQFQMY